MKLTPLDIRKHQFNRAFRGLDGDEVRAFLEHLAKQWEEVLDEHRVATDRVRELETKLKHYERVELALQEALEAARETARRAEASAEERARIIVEDAELKAQRVVQDAEQERYGLRQDLARLSHRQNEIAARLRAFLMSELEILAQFQGDDPIGFIKLVAASERSAAPADQLPAHVATDDLDADLETELAEMPDAAAEARTTENLTASDERDFADERDDADEPNETAPLPADDGTTGDAAADAATADVPPARPSFNSRFFTEPPAPRPTADPVPGSDAAQGWSLRTLVTGQADEAPEDVAASADEREKIRRILEDLD